MNSQGRRKDKLRLFGCPKCLYISRGGGVAKKSLYIFPPQRALELPAKPCPESQSHCRRPSSPRFPCRFRALHFRAAVPCISLPPPPKPWVAQLRHFSSRAQHPSPAAAFESWVTQHCHPCIPATACLSRE